MNLTKKELPLRKAVPLIFEKIKTVIKCLWNY